MTVFFSQLINGLSLGSIYALIALGYSMVYGIILLLNFAHGDIIMVGAYMSWFVMNLQLMKATLSPLTVMAQAWAISFESTAVISKVRFPARKSFAWRKTVEVADVPIPVPVEPFFQA